MNRKGKIILILCIIIGEVIFINYDNYYLLFPIIGLNGIIIFFLEKFTLKKTANRLEQILTDIYCKNEILNSPCEEHLVVEDEIEKMKNKNLKLANYYTFLINKTNKEKN